MLLGFARAVFSLACGGPLRTVDDSVFGGINDADHCWMSEIGEWLQWDWGLIDRRRPPHLSLAKIVANAVWATETHPKPFTKNKSWNYPPPFSKNELKSLK